jgi:hypothetical protein
MEISLRVCTEAFLEDSLSGENRQQTNTGKIYVVPLVTKLFKGKLIYSE